MQFKNGVSFHYHTWRKYILDTHRSIFKPLLSTEDKKIRGRSVLISEVCLFEFINKIKKTHRKV